MAKPLPEICFDTNLTSGEHRYPLVFEQSRADLAALGDRLREDLRVRLVMTEDLMCTARLKWDSEADCWIGEADPDSYVDLC